MMKQIYGYILVIIFSLVSQHVFSQWYFETGVNDSRFSEYNDSNPTTLNSYGGLRDFSHAVGYVFPFKKLEDRAQSDAKSGTLGLKIGVGFDQMNLKEKATRQGAEAFLSYNLAQLQARLGVLFTQTLVRKQGNFLGVRQPAVNLILDAGISYNFYTSATRTLIGGLGGIVDLKDDDEFDQSYPAYVFGAGFEFPLNKYSALYAKYEIENAFSNDEDSQSGFEEEFTTYKGRTLVGLRIDFRLKNYEKRQQLDRMAALEEKGTDELDALQQKVAELEHAINSCKYDDTALQEHLKNKDIHVHESQQSGALLKIQEHDKGFNFFPAFKHVLFSYDSSNFEKDVYASKLTSLARFMKENTNYRMKLVGYADVETGTANYNKNLSAQRAKNVYDYLLSLGVPANRMEHTGFGGTSKFSIDEKSKNRRTEILITIEE